MRYIVMMAVGCLALTGCDSAKRGAEDAVRSGLKDPDSAKFGEFYFNPKTKKGCLTVNAKNSMGGYTGDQEVRVQRTDDGWQEQGIGVFPMLSCREAYADATE